MMEHTEMITPDTVLYTVGTSIDDVIAGFLQCQDAEQLFGGDAWQAIAEVLVSHVEEMGEATYVLNPDNLDSFHPFEFTCEDIARRIEAQLAGKGTGA
jgi:hypothetical protein